MSSKPDSPRRQLRGTLLGNVLSTGLTGGICVGISLFAGYKIDEYLQSHPYGILGGIFFGIAAAGVQTWKQLNESMSSFKRDQ
ncbi:MAG TPA: AtpZ/AtpI family protein [Candidatus Rifleibacterium sp.]|nr:AtpZ/AtpI family protein [Candidatus Rifleibacterium sp.]HPT45993.1 AtpZ/AtpI family protein [Candidatus Rifleibacterium sp.]